MRFKTTLILLAVGIAAALFFLVVERPREAGRDENTSLEGRLTGVLPDDVDTMTIERPDMTIAARRHGERWAIVSPVEDAADDAALNTLLRSVCDAAVERRIDVGEGGLAEYGLEPPSAVIHLGTEDGLSLLELSLGEHNVTKSHCYATVGSGREVILVPAGIRRYALRTLFEFRERRILDAALEGVQGVEIASPRVSMAWRLDRRKGWFTVDNGDTVPGDTAAIEAVVRELRGLRALDITIDGAEKRAEYLSPPAGSITLGLAPGAGTIQIRFGGRRGDRCYAECSADGRVSLLGAAVLDLLDRTVNDLRDRRLLHYDENGLANLTLETVGKTVTILISGTGWTYSNPGFGEIDEESAAGLLTRIKELKFEKVIDDKIPAPGNHGFNQPFFRLVLLGDGGAVIDELTVGGPAPGDRLRYATSRSAPFLSVVGTEPLSEIESQFGGRAAR